MNVRELPDGRVLVGDGPERRLVIADFAAQTTLQVGANGHGPGEYPNAPLVYPLRGDTSLAVDAQARRWLLLVAGRVLRGVPADHAAVAATAGMVLGADTTGAVLSYRVEAPKPGVSELTRRDSMSLVLVRLSDGRSDTVARARRTAQTYIGWEGADGRLYYVISREAYAAGEWAAVSPDGWVAIVRLDPYRVDWRAPDGRVVRGAPIPYDRIRFTERERAFYAERFARVMRLPPNLPAWLSTEQRATAMAALRRQWTDFPEFVPPIEPPVITAITDRHVFIRRTATAGAPNPVWDVVDRRGQLVARLELRRGERLLGSGRGVIYVAAEDEDGLDHLRRHRWP